MTNAQPELDQQRQAQRATQRSFASSALAALCVGFAIATAGSIGSWQLRLFNGSLALGCCIACALLKPGSRAGAEVIPRNSPIATLPSTPSIDFSIIIPVYNRPQFIRTILTTLSDHARSWSNAQNGEIVIVDDGSSDDTAQVAKLLAASMPLPTSVISVAHAGPGAARNAGFAAARGVVGVSIDSDCVPEVNWLSGLLAEVQDRPKTVAFAQLRVAQRYAYPIENMPDSKGFVSASFAMNRVAFCELGGFFTQYGMSHEDFDFVEGLKHAGYRIVRAESQIAHPLRLETPKSMWRVGLNSKYGNLFVLRHGSHARHITRMTPYYYFGIMGNYGSSIIIIVWVTNLVATAALAFTTGFASGDLPLTVSVLGVVAAGYVLGLALLGLRVGAGIKRLPLYVATLGTFQIATLFGRIVGSIQYRLFLI